MELDSNEIALAPVLEALAHSTRRQLLFHLRDQRVASVDELASAVDPSQTARFRADGARGAPERLTIAVAHTHLPKLADARCIEYDHRSRTARYADPPAAADALLDALEDLESDLEE